MPVDVVVCPSDERGIQHGATSHPASSELAFERLPDENRTKRSDVANRWKEHWNRADGVHSAPSLRSSFSPARSRLTRLSRRRLARFQTRRVRRRRLLARPGLPANEDKTKT